MRSAVPILEIPSEDEWLDALTGTEIVSSLRAPIRYLVRHALGEGGMSVAFLADQQSSGGTCAVVLKIILPSVALEQGSAAMLFVQKEAVALGRLNERVPPTPFVVRLFDTGTIDVKYRGKQLALPWLVLEYVDGGIEGTTLTDRVEQSISTTSEAFDPTRAAHALECISSGLDAVHDVGVIHRDIKPENVLCCGFGDSEIMKVADFGIARPAGVAATFGGLVLGTLGYAPPELFGLDPHAVGTATDVFGLAALVYFMLTGEDCFQATMVAGMVRLVRDKQRRSITECPALATELRERRTACQAIDAALARATSNKASERPQTAGALAGEIVPWLRPQSRPVRPSAARIKSLLRAHTEIDGWTWRLLAYPGADQPRIRDVAWDADGCCLAATNDDLAFWDGTCWRPVCATSSSPSVDARFVSRSGPGRWVVGGGSATLASYGREGLREVLRGSDPAATYELMSGDPDDLLVVAESTGSGERRLHALVGGRWLKPLPLEAAASLIDLARVDEESWLVVTGTTQGTTELARYWPLDWELAPLTVPSSSVMGACAGRPDLKRGLACGSDGGVLWIEDGQTTIETIPSSPALTAAAVDALGRGWAASTGAIWLRHHSRAAAPVWRLVWEEPRLVSSIVSLFVDVGAMLAVTVDGGVIEGRLFTR